MAAVDEGTVASRGEPGSTFYSSVSERNLHYPLLVVELFSSPAIVLSRICCLVQGYGGNMVLQGGARLSSLCAIRRGNNGSDSVHSEKVESDYRNGNTTVFGVEECEWIEMHMVR